MKTKVTKKEIISKIFEICKSRNNFVFSNDLVRKVIRKFKSKTNPYDMTKLDDTSKFPQSLIDEDYFIIHMGKGIHKFVKGIDKAFHKFEEISNDEVVTWNYRRSILNDYSISESAILSLCFNHRILHNFLYSDQSANPKIYFPERKNKINFEYSLGEERIKTKNLQIEVDLTTEENAVVTVFEGKNAQANSESWPSDFNILQLYNPFRYYHNLKLENKLKIKNITGCYLVRKKRKDGSIVRLYNYTFTNPNDPSSIKLLTKSEYRVFKKGEESKNE